MKLNNHGFGTKELIISAVIIFALLLLCGFYIRRLYDVMEDNTSYSDNSSAYTYHNNSDNNSNAQVHDYSAPIVIDYVYYKDYEKKMDNAAISYVNDYAVLKNDDSALVNMIDLVDLNYITPLRDKYDDSLCEGYAIISKNETVISSQSYVKCTNYTTEGY